MERSLKEPLNHSAMTCSFFLSFFLPPWLVLQSVNFVTASDDNTCAIWDLRNTKERLRTLEGHTGWVKNCEVFGTNLVTFALDATLRNWDISEFTPAREVCADLLMAGDKFLRCEIEWSGAWFFMVDVSLS